VLYWVHKPPKRLLIGSAPLHGRGWGNFGGYIKNILFCRGKFQRSFCSNSGATKAHLVFVAGDGRGIWGLYQDHFALLSSAKKKKE
jgi:hypothetical protein